MDYSDDEYDYEEEQRVQKVEQLKDLSLKDYLAYPETRNILENEWNKHICETLEEPMSDMWKELTYECGRNRNMLNINEKIHEYIFYEIVKHHLVPQYNLQIFDDDPDLANGLVHNLDSVRAIMKKNEREKMNINFKDSNKEFKWGR